MRPPARTGATGLAPVPPTWDAVRQWAADNGLDSAAALQRWLNAAARRTQNPSLDPREAALLRALQQYSLTPVADRPLQGIRWLPANYEDLLVALSSPLVGSTGATHEEGRPIYPPGIEGPEWIRPLVDPLAEGGRLWPPSPVTTLVRMNEVAGQAFGYAPIDSDAMLLDLADRGAGQGRERATDALARQVRTFGWDIAAILERAAGLRANPAAPRLASDADITEARRRWPSVTPFLFEGPYLFVVAPGHAQDPLGRWTAADGPVHVAMVVQDGIRIGRLVVSDATGDVIDASGVFQQYDAGPHTLPGILWLIEASGNDPRLLIDLVVPFVRAVREQRPGAAGMALLPPSAHTTYWTRGQGFDPPLAARAFEPAEVLAALLAERRAAAAAAIDEATATATAGGLANLAARAYRGDIATANVPEEVRQLIAARAIAKACGPGATPQDRARVPGAAHVLGLSGAVGRQDLAAVCDASVDIARRLYGRT